MKNKRYLILGAGPRGLVLANLLIDGEGREQVVVLEKENVSGGLCWSEEVGGAPLDIDGGHFLDMRRQDVLDFVFRGGAHPGLGLRSWRSVYGALGTYDFRRGCSRGAAGGA